MCSVSYDSNSLCCVCVISSIEEAVQEGNGVCGFSYDSNSLCCVCVISSIEEAVQEGNGVCVVFLTTATVCVVFVRFLLSKKQFRKEMVCV